MQIMVKNNNAPIQPTGSKMAAVARPGLVYGPWTNTSQNTTTDSEAYGPQLIVDYSNHRSHFSCITCTVLCANANVDKK